MGVAKRAQTGVAWPGKEILRRIIDDAFNVKLILR